MSSWDYDASDIPDSMGGFDQPLKGSYHLQVVGVLPDGDEYCKNNEMVVDFEILVGTTPNQEGKHHREYFSKPTPDQDPEKRMNTVKRALQFAIATGLTTEEEQLAAKKANKKPPIPDFTMAVGRQCCGKLSESEYNGKTRMKLGYDMWAVDSPKAQGIPLNKGMLGQDGNSAANPFGDAGDAF